MDRSTAFRERIDALLVGPGVRAVARAMAAGHGGMPRDASLTEQARLIVCLEGKAWFLFREDEAATEVELKPGAALYVAPGRWVKAQPRLPYVSLGIVFYAKTTRFYLMRGRPARPGDPVETCIIPMGLDEDGRALSRLLAGPLPVVAATRFFRNAGECLLVAARGLLAAPTVAAPTGKARFTWQAACDYIADNLQRPLSRKDAARHLRVHPNHLSRLFAEFSHETFTGYLQEQRLERARLLLADPRLNVAEVARLSGFASANYFARLFRQRMGVTPTRARRS